MKNKDVPKDDSKLHNNKNAQIKKLGDKIGPADRSKKLTAKDPKKTDSNLEDEKRSRH